MSKEKHEQSRHTGREPCRLFFLTEIGGFKVQEQGLKSKYIMSGEQNAEVNNGLIKKTRVGGFAAGLSLRAFYALVKDVWFLMNGILGLNEF